MSHWLTWLEGELVSASWPIFQAFPHVCPYVYHVAGSAHTETGEKRLQSPWHGDSLLRSPNYLALSELIKLPSQYNLASCIDFPIGRDKLTCEQECSGPTGSYSAGKLISQHSLRNLICVSILHSLKNFTALK